MKLTASLYKKFNIRAEVLLAELLTAVGREDYDNIVLQPDGGFNKMISQDIRAVVKSENEFGLSSQKVMLARSGLYDALPSGLFHKLSTKVNSGSKSGIYELLQRIKDRKEEEKEARTFFAPFDQVINGYRLLLESEERKILTGFPVGARHTLFDAIWSDFHGGMTNYQKSLLFTMMPLTPQIIGDMQKTETAMSAVLDTTVKIGESPNAGIIQLDDDNLRLGNFSLSQDFILGDISEEKEKIYTIQVGPVSIENCVDYLPDGRSMKTLSVLNEYFLPLEIATQVYVNVVDSMFILEDQSDYQTGTQRLGYTTQL